VSLLSLHLIKLLPLIDPLPAGRQEILQLLVFLALALSRFFLFGHFVVTLLGCRNSDYTSHYRDGQYSRLPNDQHEY
jgi:thiosulfate reductase cytochrome b subunit